MSLSRQDAQELLAQTCRKYCQEHKISISELARKMNIARETLSNVINKNSYPSTTSLEKILSVISFDYEQEKQLRTFAGLADVKIGKTQRRPSTYEKERKSQDQIKETKTKEKSSIKKLTQPGHVIDPTAVELPPEPKKQAEKPHPPSLSIWDELVLAIAEELKNGLIFSGAEFAVGKNLDGLRFVLTSDSFKEISEEATEEEIEDTRKLIEELRRRIALFAQLKDAQARNRTVATLGPELDELFVLLETYKSEFPILAVRVTEKQRDTFSLWREGKE